MQRWIADAPLEYTFEGKLKKKLSTGTIPGYMSKIDIWWSTTAGQPRGILMKQPQITSIRREITASYESSHRQVHGITAKALKRLLNKTDTIKGAEMILKAAYSLAWYGMLRPSEYMTTPGHPDFNSAKHTRAGDIELYRNNRRLHPQSTEDATHMIINIKQGKSDHQRLGSSLTIGTTDDGMCPVRHMQNYLRKHKPPEKGPIFPGLQYSTMLKVLRKLIGHNSDLYGLHSFRVGGAQALALTGKSLHYIMAKGRWKNVESVIRYVQTPLYIRTADSRLMAKTTQPITTSTHVWGDTRNTTERELPLEHLKRGPKRSVLNHVPPSKSGRVNTHRQ
jgi:hypothetical protein